MAIKIDAATLRSNATQLNSYRDSHDSNIQSVKAMITSMCNTDVFDGATASAYLARMESFESTMQAFSQMLLDFSTNLNRIATNFEDTDTGLASSLNA